jgi:hypothetical protein
MRLTCAPYQGVLYLEGFQAYWFYTFGPCVCIAHIRFLYLSDLLQTSLCSAQVLAVDTKWGVSTGVASRQPHDSACLLCKTMPASLLV